MSESSGQLEPTRIVALVEQLLKQELPAVPRPAGWWRPMGLPLDAIDSGNTQGILLHPV